MITTDVANILIGSNILLINLIIVVIMIVQIKK